MRTCDKVVWFLVVLASYTYFQGMGDDAHRMTMFSGDSQLGQVELFHEASVRVPYATKGETQWLV